MDYKISRNKKEFTPYTVTFEIKTKSEAIFFHDEIAIKIANKKNSQFIQRAYDMISEDLAGCAGEINTDRE